LRLARTPPDESPDGTTTTSVEPTRFEAGLRTAKEPEEFEVPKATKSAGFETIRLNAAEKEPGMLRALRPLTVAPYSATPNAPGFIEAASGGTLIVSMAIVKGGGGGKNCKSVRNSAAFSGSRKVATEESTSRHV
jgi:hypothetical protein